MTDAARQPCPQHPCPAAGRLRKGLPVWLRRSEGETAAQKVRGQGTGRPRAAGIPCSPAGRPSRGRLRGAREGEGRGRQHRARGADAATKRTKPRLRRKRRVDAGPEGLRNCGDTSGVSRSPPLPTLPHPSLLTCARALSPVALSRDSEKTREIYPSPAGSRKRASARWEFQKRRHP